MLKGGFSGLSEIDMSLENDETNLQPDKDVDNEHGDARLESNGSEERVTTLENENDHGVSQPLNSTEHSTGEVIYDDDLIDGHEVVDDEEDLVVDEDNDKVDDEETNRDAITDKKETENQNALKDEYTKPNSENMNQTTIYDRRLKIENIDEAEENLQTCGAEDEKSNEEDSGFRGKVGLIKKHQVKHLLFHLRTRNVLSGEEYGQCISKRGRVGMCNEMLDIVLRKEGGQEAIKLALAEVRDETSSDVENELSEVIKEKENEILKLKAEADDLRRQLAEKKFELEALKNRQGIVINEPSLTSIKERTMISSIEERSRATDDSNASHGTRASLQIDEDFKQIKQEVQGLANQLACRDKEIQFLRNFQELFPIMAKVMGNHAHQLHVAGRDLPVSMYCPDMKFSSTCANSKACHINSEGELINTQSSRGSRNEYKKYQGTSGTTPFILHKQVSSLLPHPIQYWECHTVVSLEVMLLRFHTLFEVGLCEESFVDKMTWLYKSPRAWCVRVVVCREHRWGICAQIYGSAAKHGLCFTNAMTNVPERTATLCYGVVLDVNSGRLAFIDIGKERVLHSFDAKLKENVYPMFGVESLPDACSINVGLKSGEQVDMTEDKKRLIGRALSH